MNRVHWPAGCEPDGAAIYQVNAGHSKADPERVWAWLTRPDRWEDFYSNVSHVRHLAGPWPRLGMGTRWSWVTFNVPVTTEITEWVPYERIAWTGTGRGSRGYHAWVLTPDAEGTVIHTEETQRGLASRIARPVLGPRMHRLHQEWVEQLAVIADGWDPPA